MDYEFSSEQHDWFVSARKGEDAPFRDWFIWSSDAKEYAGTRIIFQGIEESNWAKNKDDGQYYLHRFFSHQPDLNYRNPAVLLAMTTNLIFWAAHGFVSFVFSSLPLSFFLGNVFK